MILPLKHSYYDAVYSLQCFSVLILFQILQDEVDQRKSSAENVKQLAGKLIDEYNEEDTQYMRDLLAKVIKRWSSLTTK